MKIRQSPKTVTARQTKTRTSVQAVQVKLAKTNVVFFVKKFIA